MSSKRFAGDARHWPGLAFTTFLFFVYVYLPIAVLIALSFNENRTVTVWTGFSLDWYRVAFANDDMVRAATNSLLIAAIASTSATVLATLAALRMETDRFRGKAAFNALVALPITVPEIVPAVATLMFFVMLRNWFGFDLGLGNIMIAHSVFCIPFAFMPIRARLQDMDVTLEHAARDLYASAWNAFRHVTLPLLMPGVIAGAMLAFVISFDDFIITQMISGPGTTTLPVYIYSMIRQGVTPEVNAASTILIVVSTVFVTVYWYVSRPKKT